MPVIVKNLFRFSLFMLVQVYVLDNIRLHQMVTPYLYFLFILWLPFHINRTLLMIIGFAVGFTLDSFRHQPGFHASACVLIAYLRPFLINILIPQEGAESNYLAPSVQSMGGLLAFMVYAGLLAFIHNAWVFLLEAWQFGSVWYFLTKTLLSTAITLVLILITELIFSRKQRFRTNTT
ncbi:MAG: rod shape-determining protein MreD [Ferruginibacter sp.]|nr:rod shape-determining protein MreD [Ferruginibacter sp.]